MIRELLNEKLITLVFGVVLRDENSDDAADDRRRNVQIQNFIKVHMYICKGMFV